MYVEMSEKILGESQGILIEIPGRNHQGSSGGIPGGTLAEIPDRIAATIYGGSPSRIPDGFPIGVLGGI